MFCGRKEVNHEALYLESAAYLKYQIFILLLWLAVWN